MELQIFDAGSNKDILISLSKLLLHINVIDKKILCGDWKVMSGTYGYGKLICSIEDALETREYYIIKGEKLFPVLISL